MDYREFELANERCKPKHFGPPTRLQRRLAYDAAHRSPHEVVHIGAGARLIAWIWRLVRRPG